MRLFNLLASSPWAITPDYLQHMCEVYNLILERKARGESVDITAIAKELGRPLDNTRVVTSRNGVAIIPIEGAMFRRADMFTEFSGGVSVETLARDFNIALENPSIHSILFDVDSPGGEVNGIAEFADMIYAARDRKRIAAYVSDTGASAAYWIASAAEEITVASTGIVGSIGIIAAIPDPNKKPKDKIEFVSSQSPKKRPDPTTEGGKAELQSLVDSLADVFVADVARNRGVSAETVINDFGRGGLLVGEAAVEAGMADRVGSFEQVLSELTSNQSSMRPRMAASSTGASVGAANSKSEVNSMSTENEKSFFAKWFGKATPEEKKEIAAELGITADASAPDKPATAPHQVAASQPEESEQMKSLRAQIETERNARIRSEATAFAESEILAHRALPAEKETIIALFTQAALDDSSHPAKVAFVAEKPGADGKMVKDAKEGTRVEALHATYAARPAHNLTREMVAFDETSMRRLDANAGGSDAEIAAAREQGKKYAESMNSKRVN